MRFLAPLALLASASAMPATASATTYATDASDGPIAGYDGTVAWSRWDRSISAYRLIVSHAGKVVALPVAPSQRPFDVSAGPGPTGSVWLVWSREGDVVSYDLADPGERRIAAAATAGAAEFSPSIWRDRVAFARTQPPAGMRARTTIAVAPIAGGRAQTVPAIPPTDCNIDLYGACSQAKIVDVSSTALRRDRLLVTARVQPSGAAGGICGDAIVRYLNLRNRDARELAHGTCGLSGQTFASAAFETAGRAWYVRTCPGDGGPCGGARSGPFFYDPSTGRTHHLATTYGDKLRAVAIIGIATPIVETIGTTHLGSPCVPSLADRFSFYACGVVATVADSDAVAVSTKPRDTPPAGYRTVGRRSGLQLLRPPATIACVHADPTPQRRPVLWAGSFAVDVRGRPVPSAGITVTASSQGRTVRGVVPRHVRGRDAWSYAQLALGGRSACGRTWTLRYRRPGTALATFHVRVLRP